MKQRIISVAVMLIGGLCICAGIYRGEVSVLFEKSAQICLECIGIG
jgi:hypothetical protein